MQTLSTKDILSVHGGRVGDCRCTKGSEVVFFQWLSLHPEKECGHKCCDELGCAGGDFWLYDGKHTFFCAILPRAEKEGL